MSVAELTSRNWFGKASAGLVLGFAASLAITALFAWATVDGDPFLDARGQVAMWMMAPLWSGFLSFCFLFRSGARAWAWLGAANVALWGLYLAVRLAGS